MIPSNITIQLTEIAKQSMLERDFTIEFPPEVERELNQITPRNLLSSSLVRNLEDKLWISIDNEDTKDLDQLTYAERTDSQTYKIFVAIADVDLFVKKGSAIDLFAQKNTVSIYTPSKVFPMLPEKLSNNLTSLNEHQQRQAAIVEVEIGTNGKIEKVDVYFAVVKNKAKLAYPKVGAWLEHPHLFQEQAPAINGLQDQIILQDQIAQHIRHYLYQEGALSFETIESHPVIEGGQLVDLKISGRNRARSLIENFMITANTAMAKYLNARQLPFLQRVVRIPKRWDRIVSIAMQYKEVLPESPNSEALNAFLLKRKQEDPINFPTLSLVIIKLLGNGEYVVKYPGEKSIGHFDLAIKNYTHSTAPNRRFTDLIIQRLLKACLLHQQAPYIPEELENLAKHCTEREDEATKVERKLKKSAAILILSSKMFETFDGLVTGASHKGTWVRIFNPLAEGKLIQGYEGVDVGDHIKVKLVYTNLEKGFIDFVKVS